MDFYIDCGYATMNKHGEELCGDRVQIVNTGDYKTLVLADGMGSGVRANILATMTSKILSTMVSNGAGIDECVEIITETLPVNRDVGLNYCTFTIIHVHKSGSGIIFEFDNPQAIFYHAGECRDLERTQREIAGETVYRSQFQLEAGDYVMTMSDGVIFAGPDETMNYNWQRPQVKQFLNSRSQPTMSACVVSAVLGGACMALYADRPKDDTTIAAVKAFVPFSVAVMVGPPLDRANEQAHIQHFLDFKGCHIVCGGTTSELVAGCMNREIRVTTLSDDPEVPPISLIDGIDLVTEGALTIAKVAKLSDEYLDPYALEGRKYNKNNGASKMASILFEKASDITFFIGNSVNEAHFGTVADSEVKTKALEHLCRNLRAMGKEVKEIYH